MKYCSTRGKEKNLTFKQVLFAGYSGDGGLYMPESVPKITEKELKEWSTLSYKELVFTIARRFIDEEEIPSNDLKEVVFTSLKRFRVPEVVRIEKLDGGLNIIELFHGVTLAFKDLALSVVGGLLNYFLKKDNAHITAVVGTSGDTGSAAIESIRGLECMDIVVLLPHGRCTKVQELQMTTVIEDNVHVYCVDGNSDELDEPIKKAFLDTDFVAANKIISINSINWGRILAQVAHYFYSYYQLCESVGSPVQLVVPTGAAGNITGGSLASAMGLPITLVAAVNTNDIVRRTLQGGDFSIKENVVQTFASAMDIQMPYNVERILFHFTGNDTKRVKELMNKFEKEGKVSIPNDVMKAMKEVIVGSLAVDNDHITEIMKKVLNKHNYLLCPHTATAVAYHFQQTDNSIPRGYIATASPAKFPEAVIKAGAEPVTEGVAHLENLPTKFTWMKKGDDWYSMLRTKIEEITAKKSRK
ncbi:unnamed protein product [Meganyctiphanes norvegica]|uniref:Threonine synthase-like 2 n=1 Tax=Meganyctiphanes norvegica TaxID=48144 RepID=A0AAV2PWI9_MEGNR